MSSKVANQRSRIWTKMRLNWWLYGIKVLHALSIGTEPRPSLTCNWSKHCLSLAWTWLQPEHNLSCSLGLSRDRFVTSPRRHFGADGFDADRFGDATLRRRYYLATSLSVSAVSAPTLIYIYIYIYIYIIILCIVVFYYAIGEAFILYFAASCTNDDYAIMRPV